MPALSPPLSRPCAAHPCRPRRVRISNAPHRLAHQATQALRPGLTPWRSPAAGQLVVDAAGDDRESMQPDGDPRPPRRYPGRRASTSCDRARARSCSISAACPHRARPGRSPRRSWARSGGRIEDRLPARRRHQDPPARRPRTSLPDGERAPRARPGHPSIVTLYASGESEDPEFVPASIRDHVESEFVILERMEMSLEERLKGSRGKGKKEDLLTLDMRERVFQGPRLPDPGRLRRRVRPPRPERLPPRHQAGQHPHPPPRREPPRLDPRGPPRRLQRREAERQRDRLRRDADEREQRPRDAVLPEPGADERSSSSP